MTESNASFTWEMEAVWGSSLGCAHVTLTAGAWFLALNAREWKTKAISKLQDRMEEFQTRLKVKNDLKIKVLDVDHLHSWRRHQIQRGAGYSHQSQYYCTSGNSFAVGLLVNWSQSLASPLMPVSPQQSTQHPLVLRMLDRMEEVPSSVPICIYFILQPTCMASPVIESYLLIPVSHQKGSGGFWGLPDLILWRYLMPKTIYYIQ